MRRLTLILALVSTMCYTQAQVVSNVRAMQQDTTLVIVYDLQSSATTNLQVSFDGGLTFITARAVSGDIGNTTAGMNRIAYWNATKDVGYFDCDKMVFKIIATGRHLDSYESAVVPGKPLNYNHCRVYQDGRDITPGYKNFLRNNCPEAYRAYKSKWHGMFWGGLATTTCMIPFTIGALVSDSAFGLGTGFGFMSICVLTGIPLMCCSTIAARKHSANVYNNKCGLLDITSFNNMSSTEQPVLLSFGSTSQGIGMSVQF